MKILVADDDRVLSQLVSTIVREAGHTPILAYDAMQALMFAIRAPMPECIILDINMPGGAGLDTLRKLKSSAKASGIPVIVISGSTDPNLAQQALDLGAATFLPKPIVPEALTVAIRRALGQDAPPTPEGGRMGGAK